MLKTIAQQLLRLEALQPVFDGLSKKTRSMLVYGLDDSARNMLMAAIRIHTGSPALILTADAARAARVYEEILAVFGEEEVYFYPGKEMVYYHDLFSESGDDSGQRVSVMQALSQQKNMVIVTSISGLISKMAPPGIWRKCLFCVSEGDNADMGIMLSALVAGGYERAEPVEVPGQFSVRGGILDIFPVGHEQPFRLEFFDNTVESVRHFDPQTQRSSARLEKVQILPAREIVVTETERRHALNELRLEMAQLSSSRNKSTRTEAGEKLREKVAEYLEKIENGLFFPGMEQYLHYFYPEAASLLDWLPEDALIFIDDPQRCELAASRLADELLEAHGTLLAQGELLSRQADLTWDYSRLLSAPKQPVLAFSLFAHGSAPLPYRRSTSVSSKASPRFLGQWQLFREEVEHWRQQGYRIAILTSTRQRSTGIADILADQRIPASYALSDPELLPRTVTLLHGVLDSGFIVPDIKLVVLTEQEILPRRQKKRRLVNKEGVRIGDYHELQTGDYVVHENHGIGQYLGLRTLEVDGVQKDYLYIQYAGNDKLYLPIEQMDNVRKYIGAEGKKPKLYTLGGGEWSRVKARVQASVQELARELLVLYAAREAEVGHAFSSDHSWQQEFEAAFSYEETPDQLQAIAEVKKDMERSSPMDRLICGDVGFGKTEVALRAAFKAVMDGKQAAFLVPTTVLAQQHFRTFTERMEGFPLSVGVLSRFQSAAEQKDTLKRLRDGRIDLLVGTHRILSKDVRFHDLGLLVVDEEQRFGVRHKERIKILKKNVDVLTMTATPIPRTLHMAMAGVRDMSVIETPPENRYPIQTYVLEYSDLLIKEAVLREIGRGGQVYFVHNRVQSIDHWAARLRLLLPGVAIAVAHGQMPEDRLEQMMVDFMQGGYQLLLSTTIVEAGLDIPNVNTIIIYDADKFGLAQLYQLRGRVGRSNRVAYCYLTYQKDKVLTEVAEKRLKAIKEFTELGSGFKVALRDLEIRGTGNILGYEQHGFMMTVGFDLYIKLLEEAIREYQGTKGDKKSLPRFEIRVDAYLPASYIADARQKIVFYQKVAAVQNISEVGEAREELSDRYGPLPPAAENLLMVAHLRLLAAELGILTLSEEKGEIQIRLPSAMKQNGDALYKLTKRLAGRLSVTTARQFVLALRFKGCEDKEKLRILLELFNELKNLALDGENQV